MALGHIPDELWSLIRDQMKKRPSMFMKSLLNSEELVFRMVKPSGSASYARTEYKFGGLASSIEALKSALKGANFAYPRTIFAWLSC